MAKHKIGLTTLVPERRAAPPQTQRPSPRRQRRCKYSYERGGGPAMNVAAEQGAPRTVRPQSMADEPLLRLNSVGKRFPGVIALQNVSFDVRAGEVHAICGENGAGKSTLMKIVSGQYRPDEGEIFLDGREHHFASTLEAQAAGIAIIHQELNLIPHLSIAENIFL